MAQDDGFADRPVPVKKGGGCLKWLLILGAISGFFVLACCGFLGGAAYLFKPTMVQSDPEVRTLAAEVANLDVPADLHGKLGMKIDNFMMTMRICSFEHSDGRGQMMLTEMKMKVGDQAQQEEQLKQQMRQQGAGEMRTLNVEHSETRELTINGQPAEFTFAEGQDAATSTKYHEVKGQFTGKNGVASLHLQLEDEVWDEAAVTQMLEAAK